MPSGFKGLANLPVGRLKQPSGGIFAGRYIPKNRLNDENWLRVLELRKPPEDGLYIPRQSVMNTKESKPKKKGFLYKIAKAMVDYERKETDKAKNGLNPKSLQTTKERHTKTTASQAQGPGGQEKPLSFSKITDWNALSPDIEAQHLGLEQLEHGESISIIGAGISGLTLAWILNRSRPDLKVTVYDKNAEVGGWMNSTFLELGTKSKEASGTVLCESGPRTLLPSHPGSEILIRILAEIGLRDTLMAGVARDSPTNQKALVYNGKIEQLPNSLKQTWKFLIGNALLKGSHWDILKDLWTPARPTHINDESVRSFMKRRVGSKLADRMISAIMRGIYAADVDKISARSVARLSRLYYLERTEQMSVLGAAFSGSLKYLDEYAKGALPTVFDALAPPSNQSIKASDRHLVNAQNPIPKFSLYGFPGGIQGVTQAIAADLGKRNNVEIKLGCEVQSIEMESARLVKLNLADGSSKTNSVICTVATPSLFLHNKALQTDLREQQYSSLAVVNVWVADPAAAKDWFGILVPKTEDEWNKNGILGVIFDSSVRAAMGNPDKCGGSSMTVMIGGDLWSEMSEKEASKRALAGLQQLDILDAETAAAAVTNVTLQRNCIPLYEVGHSQRQHRVMSELQKTYQNRVALIGMAFGRGVGVSDCVVDALTMALRFSEQRKLLHPEFFFGHWWSVTRPEYFA